MLSPRRGRRRRRRITFPGEGMKPTPGTDDDYDADDCSAVIREMTHDFMPGIGDTAFNFMQGKEDTNHFFFAGCIKFQGGVIGLRNSFLILLVAPIHF